MSEEEAKTKSCCGPMQAEFGKTHVVNCIGSACMAWREAEPLFGEILESRPAGSGTTNPDPEHWGYDLATHSWTRRAVTEQGFCGLAGKP